MVASGYVDFNGMIYPTSWFDVVMKLSDFTYDEYDDVYNWAWENKIPFIRDPDHLDKIYFMNDEDVMAFKLRWL